MIELPDGQCQSDHEPFQDWYATPIHKVSGPHGWPSYVAKASLGLVPVGGGRLGHFLRPGRQGAVLRGAGRATSTSCSGCEAWCSCSRARAKLHRLPREPPHDAVAPADVGRAPHRPAALEPPPWGAGPFSYEQVVQPVWDAQCVRCHDATDKQGINLTGTLDADKVPASYRTLIAGGWVHYFDYTYELRHHKAEPMTFGTLKSKLWQVLDAEPLRRETDASRDAGGQVLDRPELPALARLPVPVRPQRAARRAGSGVTIARLSRARSSNRGRIVTHTPPCSSSTAERSVEFCSASPPQRGGTGSSLEISMEICSDFTSFKRASDISPFSPGVPGEKVVGGR